MIYLKLIENSLRRHKLNIQNHWLPSVLGINIQKMK